MINYINIDYNTVYTIYLDLRKDFCNIQVGGRSTYN